MARTVSPVMSFRAEQRCLFRDAHRQPVNTGDKAWKTTSNRAFKTEVKRGKKYRFQVAAGRGPVTTIRFKGK